MTNLTRRTTLGLLAAATTVPAQARSRLSYDLKPKQVANGIWMLEGATDYFSMENGGDIVNCAILEGSEGLTVVDTGPSRRYGEAMLSALANLTGKSVTTVINTHHHPDHFFGNQVFEGVPIRALSRTGALAAEQGEDFASNMYHILGDWMRGTEVVPPTQSLASGEVTLGGRRLDVLPLSGHTESDLALLDIETGTVIAGDLAFLDRAPTTPSADLAKWRESLDILNGLGASAVIPGHGPFDPALASLAQTRAYLDWIEGVFTEAAEEGFDMIEVMELPIPDRFAEMGAQPDEYYRSVSHLFPKIENNVLPLLE
jgi:quinoprotein relay system zinc metallohydrolase 1